jgi:predicted RNA binding protein YcfA (HicA-like mRNA interferase family)
LGRLKPLAFREIKRRLESAGFEEISQKGSRKVCARIA